MIILDLRIVGMSIEAMVDLHCSGVQSWSISGDLEETQDMLEVVTCSKKEGNVPILREK